MVLNIKNENDLYKVYDVIIPLLDEYNTVLLIGDLGAGKTTFVKSIMKVLGVEEQVDSPTFAIVNEYDSALGEYAHIDLYRLESYEEALDMGIEDYLDRYTCFIEWPQIIEGIIHKAIVINISIENDHRKFEISTID